MENTSRGTALKIAICLLVAVFAQTTFVRLVPDSVGRWLAYIDWLLLVVVYICLQRNPVQALLTAAAAGLVQDAFSRGQAIGVV